VGKIKIVEDKEKMGKQVVVIKLDSKMLEKLNELKEGDVLTTEWKAHNQYGEALTIKFKKEAK